MCHKSILKCVPYIKRYISAQIKTNKCLLRHITLELGSGNVSNCTITPLEQETFKKLSLDDPSRNS